ncbi:hypothetical protein ACQI4L_02100 [Mycolicibacterium litorale]|uniref:NAD(P)H-dependent amine dehydrogenase family protein n=1 Tax=Mycolicibacterium litorale TaxID=758802 RepID=UPI003CF29BD2
MSDMSGRYRVIQWGTGETGVQALRFMLAAHDLEIVGVRCHTKAREGKSVAEIAGAPDGPPVAATTDVSALMALNADCVLYMPRDPLVDPTASEKGLPEWVHEIGGLLRHGLNVISPLQSGMHWRQLAHGEVLRRFLTEAGEAGNATVHFTGYDPGFLNDELLVTLTSAVGNIGQIRTTEVIDFGPYTGTALLETMGFGAAPREDDADETLIPNWGCALWRVADALGIELDAIVAHMESYTATEDFTSDGGLRIAAGTVGAKRWSLTGCVSGVERIVTSHVSRVGDHMAPDWPRIGAFGGFGIEIDGQPPLRVDIPLGLPGGSGSTLGDAVRMTAARCVNAIATVVAAKPGYLLPRDAPVFGARHTFGP